MKILFLMTIFSFGSAHALECKVSCYGTTIEYNRIMNALSTDSTYRLSPSESYEVGASILAPGLASGVRNFQVSVTGESKNEIKANANTACVSEGKKSGIESAIATRYMYCDELHPENHVKSDKGPWSESYWPTNDWK